MRSFIIYEVEHEDTTDPLDNEVSGLLDSFDKAVRDSDATFVNSTVVIDLPPYISATNAPHLILRTS